MVNENDSSDAADAPERVSVAFVLSNVSNLLQKGCFGGLFWGNDCISATMCKFAAIIYYDKQQAAGALRRGRKDDGQLLKGKIQN